MRVFVDNDHEGICIETNELSVHTSLTFVTVAKNAKLMEILLLLVKKGIVESFRNHNDELKIAFYTKHVKEIK